MITSSFDECPPAPSCASICLLTGHAVAQFPHPVQRSRSIAIRNETDSEVPCSCSVASTRPLERTPFGQASTQSPHRMQCPLWIRGFQPSSSRTTSIAPGAGQTIMQKSACWHGLPVGSGKSRNCGGVVRGAVRAKKNFFSHSGRTNSRRYQYRDGAISTLRAGNAGVCRDKRRCYIRD